MRKVVKDVKRGNWRYIQTVKDKPEYRGESLSRDTITFMGVFNISDSGLMSRLIDAIKRDNTLGREERRLIERDLKTVFPPSLIGEALTSLDCKAEWYVHEGKDQPHPHTVTKPVRPYSGGSASQAFTNSQPKQKKKKTRAKPQNPADKPKRVRAAFTASTHNLPERDIEIGPWAYDAQSDKISFTDTNNNESEVLLTPACRTLFLKIMSSHPRPVPITQMSDHLYGARTKAKISSTSSTYERMIESLEEQYPGSSMHFANRDLNGFRISAAIGRPKPDLTKKTTIAHGPWAYDSDKEYLFLNERVIDPQPKTRAALIALINAFPEGIEAKPLADIVYGEDQQKRRDGSDTNQNLDHVIRSYNTITTKKNKGTPPPFWYSAPLGAYMLNVPLDNIGPVQAAAMKLIEIDDITVSLAQARIWHKGNPLQKLGKKTWLAFSKLLEKQGQFVTSRELGAAIYGEVSDKNTTNAKQVMSELRKGLNSLEPDLGKRLLRADGQLGYILCPDDFNYDAAFRRAKLARKANKEPHP